MDRNLNAALPMILMQLHVRGQSRKMIMSAGKRTSGQFTLIASVGSASGLHAPGGALDLGRGVSTGMELVGQSQCLTHDKVWFTPAR